MMGLTEKLKEKQAKWWLCDRYYRDVICRAITDKIWAALRDSSNAIILLGGGEPGDTEVGNEDEVRKRKVSATTVVGCG